MAEAQMAGGGAQHGRPGLNLLAINGLLTPHQYQRPGGRDAEGMERLRGEIFADAGAQHGTAVAKAGKRGFTRPLQVQIPTLTIRRLLLTQ